MKVTVITMYRGYDAEMFTQVVEGTLTEEQRGEWRKVHGCDEHFRGDEDETNNMFFRELEVAPNEGTTELVNVDEEMFKKPA